MIKRSAVTFLQQRVQQYAGTDTAKRTTAVRDCLSPLPACIRRESAAKESVPCRNQPGTAISPIRHAAYCFAISMRLSSSAELSSGAISQMTHTAEMRWDSYEYYASARTAMSESAGIVRFDSALLSRRESGAAAISITDSFRACRHREASDIVELSMMIDQLIRDGRRIFGPGYNPFKSVISETRSKACSHAETETDNLYSLFMEKAREGKAMTGSADGGSRLRKTANETWRHGAEEECRKNQDPC